VYPANLIAWAFAFRQAQAPAGPETMGAPAPSLVPDT
jgi:hypothetical protein